MGGQWVWILALTRAESAAFWRSGEGSGPGQWGAVAVAGAWVQSEVQ